MRGRWSKGAMIAVVIAVAVAGGFLNQREAARSDFHAANAGLQLTVSIKPMALEVRVQGVALEIRF